MNTATANQTLSVPKDARKAMLEELAEIGKSYTAQQRKAPVFICHDLGTSTGRVGYALMNDTGTWTVAETSFPDVVATPISAHAKSFIERKGGKIIAGDVWGADVQKYNDVVAKARNPLKNSKVLESEQGRKDLANMQRYGLRVALELMEQGKLGVNDVFYAIGTPGKMSDHFNNELITKGYEQLGELLGFKERSMTVQPFSETDCVVAGLGSALADEKVLAVNFGHGTHEVAFAKPGRHGEDYDPNAVYTECDFGGAHLTEQVKALLGREFSRKGLSPALLDDPECMLDYKHKILSDATGDELRVSTTSGSNIVPVRIREIREQVLGDYFRKAASILRKHADGLSLKPAVLDDFLKNILVFGQATQAQGFSERYGRAVKQQFSGKEVAVHQAPDNMFGVLYGLMVNAARMHADNSDAIVYAPK